MFDADVFVIVQVDRSKCSKFVGEGYIIFHSLAAQSSMIVAPIRKVGGQVPAAGICREPHSTMAEFSGDKCVAQSTHCCNAASPAATRLAQMSVLAILEVSEM
jgi:hypothetical protein